MLATGGPRLPTLVPFTTLVRSVAGPAVAEAGQRIQPDGAGRAGGTAVGRHDDGAGPVVAGRAVRHLFQAVQVDQAAAQGLDVDLTSIGRSVGDGSQTGECQDPA